MNIQSFLVFACLFLPASVPACAQAVIEGHVELSKARSTPVMNKRYENASMATTLASNPPLAVLYLEGVFPPVSAATVRSVIQTNFTFIPALLPVQRGTKVEFPNLDSAYHNVFSYSPTKRFDLGRYRPEERPIPSRVFDKAGLVELRCDIHEHMHGVILVLDTPHFATSDTQGNFRLTNLPPGHFILKAWLSAKTTLAMPVDLKTNETLQVRFP